MHGSRWIRDVCPWFAVLVVLLTHSSSPYVIEIIPLSIFFVFFVNFVEKALAAVW